MIDEDEGVSGATKIDERAGMRRLYNLIITEQIAAVAVQAEDRLFRDETQIQVNVFIDACVKHQVRIITPHFKYNFPDKHEGSYHKLLFRMRAEQAADYLNTYVKGRLVAAKQKMLMQGMWMGGNVALGFMVDNRKNLPSGIPNPAWRKYVAFEPCAYVVREIFKIFVNLGGNVNATLKYLHDEGLHFPDFDDVEFQRQIPNGFKCEKPLRMVKKNGHFILGRVALVNMLTNSIYLGHWAYLDRIVVWNNHETIVDETLFYQAFNYLSSVLLDGTENPSYKPRVAKEHRNLRKQRKPRNAIYQGLVGTYHEDKWRIATVSWNKNIQDYVYGYNYTRPDTTGAHLWSRHVRYFDPIITKMLHVKIHAIFDKEVWEDTLSTADENFEAEQRQLSHQLNSVMKKMRTIADNFSLVTIPALLEELQNDYKNHEIEKRRIEEKLKTFEKAITERETLKELARHAERVLGEWDSYGLPERRTVANAFIEEIIITPRRNSRAADTKIIWKDNSVNEFVLPYRSDTWVLWIPEEVEILADLIAQEASQLEISAALPDRNWRAIRIKAYEIVGKREFHISPKPIRDRETYKDYWKRVEENGKDIQNTYGNRWTKGEIKTLESGLDSGATQLEIVAALPINCRKSGS